MKSMDAVAGIADALPSIWDKIIETRKAIINRDGFLYACDYEIRLNLDLLDSLSTDSGKVSAKSPAFLQLVNSFETDATLALIAGADRSSYRRLIKHLRKRQEKVTFENEEEGTEPPDPVQNTLEALRFTVRKIETLRRIACVSEIDEKIFKEIRLSTRLKNIQSALRASRTSLKEVIEKVEKQTWRCCC